MNRILAVVAHPDDESFWCGGTLAKLSSEGALVSVLVMSDGCEARPDTDAMARWVAYCEAGEELGAALVSERSCFPDQQADAVPQLVINRTVESALALYRPDVVYTHHVGDLNIDHRRVAEAVLVATRPGCSSVETVYHMRPEWPDRCVGPAWAPTHHVGIAETLEAKVRACLCYTAELRPYPHPRSERAIREASHESFMVTT